MNLELVEKLRALNATANNGRGSSTVQNILSFLDRNVVAAAVSVWKIDGDKLQQYPEMNLTVMDLLGCRTHNEINCKNRLCSSLRNHAVNAVAMSQEMNK